LADSPVVLPLGGDELRRGRLLLLRRRRLGGLGLHHQRQWVQGLVGVVVVQAVLCGSGLTFGGEPRLGFDGGDVVLIAGAQGGDPAKNYRAEELCPGEGEVAGASCSVFRRFGFLKVRVARDPREDDVGSDVSQYGVYHRGLVVFLDTLTLVLELELGPESLKVSGMNLQLCGLQTWCWLVSTVPWLVVVERQLDLSSVTARLRGSSCAVLSGCGLTRCGVPRRRHSCVEALWWYLVVVELSSEVTRLCLHALPSISLPRTSDPCYPPLSALPMKSSARTETERFSHHPPFKSKRKALLPMADINKTSQATTHSSPSSSSSSSHDRSDITQMNHEQIISILQLLPIESVLSFSMTCRKLRSLASSDSLWEAICRREWGKGPVDALLASLERRGLSWKRLYQQVVQLSSLSCTRLYSKDGIFPMPRASHTLNFVSDCLVLQGGGCDSGLRASIARALVAVERQSPGVSRRLLGAGHQGLSAGCRSLTTWRLSLAVGSRPSRVLTIWSGSSIVD
ncbi:hypothetical protein Taro_002567, partial [Colocasia esculenta]|nr:hypothetical protein [Colocasia esculenta]